MLQVYGVDTLDPHVSTRRVGVLIDRLPPYARTFGEQWSTEAELLAVLIDHVANLTWITMRAHGAKRATRPRPIPRPGLRNQPTQPLVAEAQEGSKKTGSWMDAAKQLAGVTGVKVRDLGLHLRGAHRPGYRGYR
jgi:hypothetical protein